MKQKLFSSICLVLAIVIVVTTSTTFAYLIASNTTDVSGKTADFNVKLALTTVHKSTNMVPLKDSLVVTSIKNTNKCINKNNYEVCSLYKLTLSNTGNSFTLNGYLKTSSTTYH